MTIDDAIKMYKKIANTDANCPRYCMRPCEDCVQQCRKIAEWLEELKKYRTLDKTKFSYGYNKAIDDYRTEICKAFVQSERNGNYRFYAVEIKQLIADLGEQLKAGENSEID